MIEKWYDQHLLVIKYNYKSNSRTSIPLQKKTSHQTNLSREASDPVTGECAAAEMPDCRIGSGGRRLSCARAAHPPPSTCHGSKRTDDYSQMIYLRYDRHVPSCIYLFFT